MSVTAEAVASHMSCDNEIVSVPERGRIDVVTRPLIVKVSTLKQENTELITLHLMIINKCLHAHVQVNSSPTSCLLRLRELR